MIPDIGNINVNTNEIPLVGIGGVNNTNVQPIGVRLSLIHI